MVKSFYPAPPWCPKQKHSVAPWSRSLVHYPFTQAPMLEGYDTTSYRLDGG